MCHEKKIFKKPDIILQANLKSVTIIIRGFLRPKAYGHGISPQKKEKSAEEEKEEEDK